MLTRILWERSADEANPRQPAGPSDDLLTLRTHTAPARPTIGAPPRFARVEDIGDYFTWRSMGLFAALYLVGISNSHVMTGMLVGLTAWATTGSRQAIMALSVVAMYRFSNGAVASFSPFANILLWVIVMAGSARLFADARRVTPPLLWLAAFAVIAALLSIMVSKAPDVSVMKVVSFSIVSAALLAAAPCLAAGDVARLQRWFFSLALCMALLSLLTVPFPGVGFRKVSGSLQGMFNHPQAAGVFFVPFAAWFAARVLVEPARHRPRWVLLVAVLFAGLIVASGARTAMLATSVSVALTLGILLVRGRVSRFDRSRAEILATTLLLGLASTAILASGVLSEQLESVVLKGGDQASVAEAFQSSRGAGMAQQLQNFLDAPLTGHGFGVYRYGVRGGEEHVVRFLGIPISAAAEKGVAFTSVLEETGIAGGLLFYGLLLSILAAMARGHSPGALAMVAGCIAVNFGEAVIFATGGLGLFMWLGIAFGLARARFETSDLPGVATTPRRGEFVRREPAPFRNLP